jgi:hypothetical protein
MGLSPVEGPNPQKIRMGDGSDGQGGKDGEDKTGQSEVPRGREILWRRAPGVELLGAAPGIDPAQRLFLVRRRDGQAVQLSELLYLIVAVAGRGRSTEDLAVEVGRISGRKLSVVALIHLIDRELVPLGLVEECRSG